MTKELLTNLYSVEKKSSCQIAKILNVHMDDGSHIDKSCVIYTNCFSYEEHVVMQEYFAKIWNLDVRIIRSKYNFLRFPVVEARKFLEIIKQYIHPSMEYKFEEAKGSTCSD